MEIYQIYNVTISSEEKKIASLSQATVIFDLSRIEVIVDELPLSNENIGLLRLICDEAQKELTIIGTTSDQKILKITKAMLNSLTFCAEVGKPIHLKGVSIIGFQAEWSS